MIAVRRTGGGSSRVRFVHTADWQLGMTRHFLAGEAQARFTQARLDAVARICQVAQDENAAFILVAGDVFEDNHVDRPTVLRLLGILSQHPRVPVYLLPGNHDPLDAASVFRTPVFTDRQPGHVHVIADSDPIEVAPGVELVGAPWFSKRPGQDLAAQAVEALAPASGRTRVLVAHGPSRALSPQAAHTALIDHEPLEAALEDGRVRYVALGDRHSVTAVGDSGRIWYPGTPEPTDYDEIDAGQALVVDLAADTADVRAVQVGTWGFRRREFELHTADDIETLRRWLDEPAAKECTVVRTGLRGTLSLQDHAALEAVLDDAAQTYAAVERWGEGTALTLHPDDDDLDTLDLEGFVRDAVAELRQAAAGDGDDARQAFDALTLLHRLARGHG